MISKNIKLLTWFNFFTDFKLYAPLAIIYFSQVTGSYALGTSIFSIVFISSAIFEIPTGILSDYIGRKNTVVLGAICSILFVIMYALGSSYIILVFGAILEGLARSFYSGNNDALLHDSLSESGSEGEYHHFLGRVSAMFQIALGVSAILGSIIAHFYFPAVFWASVIPQVFCLGLALKMKEPKFHKSGQSGNIYNHMKESFQLFLKNPKLRLLSLSSILGFGFGESSFLFRGAFFASVWPVWAIGIASFLSNFGATIGFYISGKIIDRFGAPKALILGSIYCRFIALLALFFPSPASPVMMTTTSIHFGISSTAKGSLMQKEFTDVQRATMGSLNSFARSICFAITTFSLGLIADRLSPRMGLILLESLMLVNVYIYWRLLKQK